MSNVQINPKWMAYNTLQNEGAEGFNPHPKWIARTPVAAKVAAQASRMLRDANGAYVPAAKVSARLAANIAKLPMLTNASAIEIISASIAADQLLLA